MSLNNASPERAMAQPSNQRDDPDGLVVTTTRDVVPVEEKKLTKKQKQKKAKEEREDKNVQVERVVPEQDELEVEELAEPSPNTLISNVKAEEPLTEASNPGLVSDLAPALEDDLSHPTPTPVPDSPTPPRDSGHISEVPAVESYHDDQPTENQQTSPLTTIEHTLPLEIQPGAEDLFEQSSLSVESDPFQNLGSQERLSNDISAETGVETIAETIDELVPIADTPVSHPQGHGNSQGLDKIEDAEISSIDHDGTKDAEEELKGNIPELPAALAVTAESNHSVDIPFVQESSSHDAPVVTEESILAVGSDTNPPLVEPDEEAEDNAPVLMEDRAVRSLATTSASMDEFHEDGQTKDDTFGDVSQDNTFGGFGQTVEPKPVEELETAHEEATQTAVVAESSPSIPLSEAQPNTESEQDNVLEENLFQSNDRSDPFAQVDSSWPPASSSIQDEAHNSLGELELTTRDRALSQTSDLFGSSAADPFASFETKETEMQLSPSRSKGIEEELFGSGQEDEFDWTPQVGEHDQPADTGEFETSDWDAMELDLMGVPEGWVDDGGQWIWYTDAERNAVAKEMIANGTATAPEREELSNDQLVTSYAPSTTQYTPYNPPPQPVQSYSPNPAPVTPYSAYAPPKPAYQPPQTYQPLQTQSTSAYTNYTPSVYTPSSAIPSSASTYQTYNSSALAPSSIQTPAVLERTKTPTAYDPPIAPLRNLARTPSAAPVISAYSPVTYGQPSNVASVASPPRTQTVRKDLAPPRSSTLTGRSTPTAYDPPVQAMSRKSSLARLQPLPVEAPPLPPLPQMSHQAAPVAPLKGPSRSASFIQPPPPSGAYRPPSRTGITNSAQIAPPPVPAIPAQFASVSSSRDGVVPPQSLYSQTPPSNYISHSPKSINTTLPPPPPRPYTDQRSMSFAPPPPLPLLPPPDRVASFSGDSISNTIAGEPGLEQLPESAYNDTSFVASPPRARPAIQQNTFTPPQYDPEITPRRTDVVGLNLPGAESWTPTQFSDLRQTETVLQAEPPMMAPRQYTPQESPAPAPYSLPPGPVPPATSNYDPSAAPISKPFTPSAYETPVNNAYGFPSDINESPAWDMHRTPGSVYEPPSDNLPQSLEEDILERAMPSARKVPCISFGPHGILVTVFPGGSTLSAQTDGNKLLPAYGETLEEQQVRLSRLLDVIPVATESAASLDWPGPLFVDATGSKVSAAAKKKRDAVYTYLDARISEIQSGLVYLTASKSDQANKSRDEARLLMLQVIRLMVVSDGKALLSEQSTKDDLVEILSAHSTGINTTSSAPAPISTSADVAPSAADLKYLSNMLVRGRQQEAQQYAIQQQLWSHALLISSVMGPQAWQTCVDAFVAQNLLRPGSEYSQPLATAYKMYGGGNQLAPHTNHAGDWRDSLSTVVANLKQSDQDSLVKLAEQFKQNGLIEAAHLCYLLSPKLAEWAASTNLARVALFGCRETASTSLDLETSELVEYAMSFKAAVKGVEPFAGVSHLLPYKFQKAWEAFSSGRETEARQYCDAVLSLVKGQKTPDQATIALGKQAETLSGRIAGLPVSVIAGKKAGKPNLENLGSWFEGRLTKFIAGDEQEGQTEQQQPPAKKDTSRAAIGPFSHYSAISSPNATPPNLTRAASAYDLPGRNGPVPPQNMYRSGSAASYRPRQPSQLSMQRPTSAMSYYEQDSHAPELSRITSHITEQETPMSPPVEDVGEVSSMMPLAEEPSASIRDEDQPIAEEAPVKFEMPTWGQSYGEEAEAEAEIGDHEETGSQPSGEGFINPMQGFMTPAAMAPSYTPASVSTALAPERAVYDDEDDDDLGLGNSANKKKVETPAGVQKQDTQAAPASTNYEPALTKEETKPAETKKPAVPEGKGSQSGSWLGKWWGKKEDAAAGPGPVKAKLGEESAFYYDKEQKRWINKSAGPTEAAKPAPPPPSASRAPSTVPSTPPISSSGTGGSGSSGPPPRSAPPPSVTPGIGGPPVRPISAAPPPVRASSNSNSNTDPPLDPMAMPPPARRTNTAKKANRYVNVM